MQHYLLGLSPLLLMLSTCSWAVNYSAPVNSQNITLVAGDTITISGGTTPALTAPSGSSAINISNGGIQISGSNINAELVLLGNNQTNNFGIGSTIALTPATDTSTLMRLNNSSLVGVRMALSGGAIFLNNASLTLSDSTINSSHRYALTTTTGQAVINLKDTHIFHTVNANGSRTINQLVGQSLNLDNVTITSSAESVIDVDRGTIPVSLKDLNIIHNTSSTQSTARAI